MDPDLGTPQGCLKGQITPRALGTEDRSERIPGTALVSVSDRCPPFSLFWMFWRNPSDTWAPPSVFPHLPLLNLPPLTTSIRGTLISNIEG